MLRQSRLQICDRLRKLAGLDLRDAQSGFFLHSFQVRNRFGRVALHQQGIAQQLVSRRRVRIQLQSMLQRGHRRSRIRASPCKPGRG